MPKDPTRNVDRYKIGGGHLNEFEFQKNQGAITEEERDRFARQEEERRLREGETAPAPPQDEAERIRQLVEAAREEAQRNIEKREKQAAATAPPRSGRAGKAAKSKRATSKSAAGAKKSGAKKTTKKSGTKKRGAKKTAAKKRAGGTAKRGAAKRAAGKARPRRARKAGGGKKAGARKAGRKGR